MINKGLAIAMIVMGSLYFSPSIIAAETDSKNLNPKAKAEADSSGWSASIADGLTPAT
mgnify:FL=1